jgi:ketosteroid isomerase-like protein
VTQTLVPTAPRRAFALPSFACALGMALLLAACAGDEPAPAPAPVAVAPAPVVAPPPPPAPTLTEAQVQALIEQVKSALRKHDTTALGAVFADDARFTVTPFQMPTKQLSKDEYLAHVRKQFARNAGAEESLNLVKLVVRTDGGQATARMSATSMLQVNGYPISQVDDQFYTVELRGTEPKVVTLVTQGQGVSAGGHQ